MFNDRQQVPPHLLYARPRVKVKDKSNHDYSISGHVANIKTIPKYSLHRWDMWHWLTYILGWLKSGTVLEAKLSSLNSYLSNLEFLKFSQ